MGTLTLEALKDVSFVLDAGITADALHNHEIVALISAIVKVSDVTSNHRRWFWRPN